MKRAMIGLASISVAAGSLALLGGFTPEPAPSASAVAEGDFSVDGVHSSLVFRVKHQDVAYFWGRFNTIQGSFNINWDNIEQSSIDVTVPTDSVDTNNKGRDTHLKGQDFFSSKEFPTITFKGTSFKKTGEHTFDITGDLTLRGVTKPVTAKGEYGGVGQGRGGEVSGFEARFSINRSDFGVNYMSGKGLGEEVQVIVGIEGGRK